VERREAGGLENKGKERAKEEKQWAGPKYISGQISLRQESGVAEKRNRNLWVYGRGQLLWWAVKIGAAVPKKREERCR